MSGFGYVRDTKPVVTDWAQVGRDMGKVITDEFTDREARKSDIEKQSAEIAKNLLDAPVGQYEQANRFVSDFSSQAQQQALADLRLLKNNAISEREYYNRRANLKSGTDLMFTAVNKFNENYDSAMQNILDGKSSVLLSDLKSQMQGYLNFADSGAYINPATASVNVSKLNPDGTVSTDPSNFMNAGMLLKLSTADFKNADLDKKIKSVQERLGSIKYTDANGTTQSISLFDLNLLDPIQKTKLMMNSDFRNKLQSSLKDEVDAIVGNVNSNTAASILADYSGEKYSLTFDSKLFNENGELKNPNAETKEIAYSPNGQVTLTEKQLAKAKEIVRNRLERGLDFSSTQKQKNYYDNKETLGEKKAKSLRKKEIGYLKSIDNAISGDTATAQASIDAMIQGANVIYGKSPGIPNIKNAVRSEDGKTLTVTRINSDGSLTEAIGYDISDPDKAGEVMVELFFPNVTGSYEELLTDFNRQGGFTQKQIKNPNYTVDEKGLPTDPNEKEFIPNPNYKGASKAGKTEAKVTIKQDFNTAEVLGEKAGDEKPLKEVIKSVDMGTMYRGNFNLRRSENMAQGAEDAFTILKTDLPNLDARAIATEKGLILKIPNLFEGDLLLRNSNNAADKTNYENAIKQIFNSLAKGTPFDKSLFEK